MVWLKSSESQLLKTFCGLKIGWILRKLWAKMWVYVLFPSSTSSTYIALQPLCVFDLSSTSLTWFIIHSIWWYGWKALSLSFSKLFADWNQLNIKKVMSKDVCVCSFPIFDIFDIHSITALICIWSIFNTFDIALISCVNLSQHLQHPTICIDMRPLMYTQ